MLIYSCSKQSGYSTCSHRHKHI